MILLLIFGYFIGLILTYLAVDIYERKEWGEGNYTKYKFADAYIGPLFFWPIALPAFIIIWLVVRMGELLSKLSERISEDLKKHDNDDKI